MGCNFLLWAQMEVISSTDILWNRQSYNQWDVTSYFEHKWKWYQLQIFSEIDEAINNGM